MKKNLFQFAVFVVALAPIFVHAGLRRAGVFARRISAIVLTCLLIVISSAASATQAGGDEVVVVYNKRMPESKAVADYYARMRQVPERQIYGFSLTTNEIMSRAEFHDSLQLPLAKNL